MSISATSVRFDEHTMWVELTDGRTLGVPLAWFPRLLRATPAERTQYQLNANESGVVITAMDQSSGLLDKGVTVGDVILQAGGRTVRTPQQVKIDRLHDHLLGRRPGVARRQRQRRPGCG